MKNLYSVIAKEIGVEMGEIFEVYQKGDPQSIHIKLYIIGMGIFRVMPSVYNRKSTSRRATITIVDELLKGNLDIKKLD